jgi:hypothetical protein
VQACLSIWLERFRGSQKEDEFGPLSIQFSLILALSQHVQYSRLYCTVHTIQILYCSQVDTKLNSTHSSHRWAVSLNEAEG